MSDWIEEHILWIIVSVFVVLISLLFWVTSAEQKEWDKYAKVHHCVAVGKKAATNGIGTAVGADGKVGMVTTYNPPQTVYQCDGGEIEIR